MSDLQALTDKIAELIKGLKAEKTRSAGLKAEIKALRIERDEARKEPNKGDIAELITRIDEGMSWEAEAAGMPETDEATSLAR